MMTDEQVDTFLDECVKHYRHAEKKHPHFADRLTFCGSRFVKPLLESYREDIKRKVAANDVDAELLLGCELFEVLEAYLGGDYNHAVYECYDAIAVIMRMIEMIRGEQAKKEVAK